MIGQEQFLNKLNRFNINNFPHSVLLLGEHGAGQFEVCEYIANRFNFELIDISDMISVEYINQIYLSSNQTLYTVDITKITEKEQNILLKLFEEPNAFTYIILYGESTYNILDTILNRSYILQMDRYTRDQLEGFVTNENKDYILSICTTPGQIEVANHTDIEALKTLCNNMLMRMNKASFGNALTIANKINFADNFDKFDLYLFIKALIREVLAQGKYDIYDYIMKLDKYIWFMNDKKRYFEHFIIETWLGSK